MIREHVETYFMEGNYNCAEAILRAANDAYGWQMSEEALRLAAGFGGGMGCGHVCGALCGGIAAISAAMVKTKAHETPRLREACADYTKAFQKMADGDMCVELMPVHRKSDVRCLALVQQAADLLDEALQEETGVDA